MSSKKHILLATVLGGLIGAGIMTFLFGSTVNEQQNTAEPKENKPLYWVAPMDANYRRDKPGKSPMGMELIPVYEEDAQSDGTDNDWGEGVVKISPHVVNNLGVRTAKAQLKSMETVISTVGYVQYDEDRLVHIHPRVDGWVEKLFIKAVGDEAKKGQALYELYSPELVNAQKEMMLALDQSSQPLIDAAHKRLLAMRMSPAFIENLIRTKEVKQTVTFYAPQSGVVENLPIREGFYVQPGTTIMSIGQLDQVWVEAEVFERDAAQVKSGLAVAMTLDYVPGKVWQGEVDYVYPSLNAQNRTLRVRLRFDNKNHELKPNMFAQVAIHAKPTGSVIVVPKESVIRTGQQERVVLALGEGQFKSIAVVVGRVEREEIEILDGLNEGDIVVTSAQFLIDSESSKSSDFKRMMRDEVPAAIWMQGIVNSVMADHRMVNITHDPAEAWGWPEMTMNFDVAQSVDIQVLSAGQQLHFEVTNKGDSGYVLTGIHIMAEPEVSTATVDGMINTIDVDKRIVNISRQAIEKWNRPAATMDFSVDEQIDLTAFSADSDVTFTFEVRDDLVIVDMAIKTPKKSDDHSGHSGH